MKQKTPSRDTKAALHVQNIHKDFYLPHEKNDSLKSAIVSIFKKKDREIDTQHALRGVSFDIQPGEFFGILGRNGSGKSTLLKILAGIYQPTKGSVEVQGKLVPFIELGVGFNPELTGRENVYLNGALLGFSKKEIDARYKEIVDFAELHDFMEQKLKNYSSGMQVRLAFSVATRAEADILLVDEVLAVGDADFQRKCFDYFKSLKKSGKTVIFVTHDMNAVREYCDRGILISDGVIAHADSADGIADEYLKLFNNQNIVDEAHVDRWGDGKVKIEQLSSAYRDGKFTIRATLASVADFDGEVRFGCRIKDQGGYLVAGVNNINAIDGGRLRFQGKQKKTIVFEMPDMFGNQSYTIDASIVSPDDTTVHDSWDNVEQFDSRKTSVYYPILCPATMEVQER